MQRKCVLACAFTLWVAGSALAQMISGGSANQRVVVSILDYPRNAPDANACTGTVHDDFLAFADFATQFAGTPAATEVVLKLPANGTCYVNDSHAALFFANNIGDLLVQGSNTNVVMGRLAIGPTQNAFYDVGHSALFQTALVGDKCVSLVTPSEVSLFPPGSWVAPTGVKLQSSSFPPNVGVFEIPLELRVASSDMGSGQVCFTTSLKNTYRSTWPTYGVKNELSYGAATLFSLQPGWAVHTTWQGVNFSTTSAPTIYGSGQRLTFRDVTFTLSPGCFDPSTGTVEFINVTTSPGCGMEVDKEIVLDIQNSTFNESVTVPSMSAEIKMRNTTLSSLIGTGGSFTGTNVAVSGSINLGPDGFGFPKAFACSACSIQNLHNPGSSSAKIVGTGHITASIAAGVISVPLASGPNPWAVPGAPCGFGGAVQGVGGLAVTGSPFQVNDISSDGANALISTTLSISAWPDLPLDFQGNLYIVCGTTVPP